ncbi:MAG: Gfo/Idh/MocA family oxidoreductase [Pirellulaceae bacterium]|nr:Gfo/Idh/MocA family oxidoreductase [Pirellulaceae bacterium]
MSDRVCRFGILSTAGIGRKNWKAMRLASNSRVAAVASRSQQAAQQFIDQCSSEVPQTSPPQAFGSYQELLDSDQVDAVYIPLPTALRHQWVIRAAEAGKHVIGEKPSALHAGQLSEMLEACRQHGVQYMDGVMFMHSQRLPLVRRLLAEPGKIGDVRRLVSEFSFAGGDEFARENIRTNSLLEPYGCLGDLGWYCIRAFYCLMDEQLPVEVRGRTLTTMRGHASPGDVPGEFSGELLFPGGVTASFYNSFRTAHQQWLHVSGSLGYLRIDDFVLPYRGAELSAIVGNDHFAIDNCSFHMESHVQRHTVNEYDAGHTSAQEVRMIQAFAAQVLSGQLNSQWPTWALHTQQIMDACYRSAQRDGAAVTL